MQAVCPVGTRALRSPRPATRVPLKQSLCARGPTTTAPLRSAPVPRLLTAAPPLAAPPLPPCPCPCQRQVQALKARSGQRAHHHRVRLDVPVQGSRNGQGGGEARHLAAGAFIPPALGGPVVQMVVRQLCAGGYSLVEKASTQ